MNNGIGKTASLSTLVDAIEAIAKKRAAALEQMRAALETNDVEAVLHQARFLCGMRESE
jgi:hypothetical protein